MSQGKGFLKVCGILMIIGGALAIISNIFVVACGGVAAAGGVEVVGAAILIAGIIGLIGGIIELITGIVGVKNCDKPENAKKCIVWGIIVLVIQIVSLILTLAGSSASAGSIIITIICGIALPVLYLIGAFLNKKNA